MKSMKAICTAAVLALALSAPAYAGDMLTPGVNTPPPPPPPELHFTGALSVPSAPSSLLGDITTPGFADILWVLALIF